MIPIWRKLLYAAVVLLVLFGTAEGLCRLMDQPKPSVKGTYPSLQIYLDTVRNKASQPRPHMEGPLPHQLDSKMLMRVAEKAPGAVDFTGGGGDYRLLAPAQFPGQRHVLVFGGSAAWGPSFDYPKTFSYLVQRGLRRRLADPGLQVVNLARPGWELNRVKALMFNVLSRLPRTPVAVILLSGNNEFLHVEHLLMVGARSRAPLALYRQLTRLFTRQGWLSPPPYTDPGAFASEQAEPFSFQHICQRIWRPGPGVGDASYWLAVREGHLTQYKKNLRAIADELRRRKIPLVLVPPPINLHYFPGGLYPQPVTYHKLGLAGYRRLRLRLESVLLQKPTLAQLEALVQEQPSGPLQRFALGQMYDAAGRRQEAYQEIMSARANMMGVLESLPAMTTAALGLRGHGVEVIDTRVWYDAKRPVRLTALKMFADSCHLTDDGHKGLAGLLVKALLRELGEKP